MLLKNNFFNKIRIFKLRFQRSWLEYKEIQEIYQDLLQQSLLFQELHVRVKKEGNYSIRRINALNMEKGSWIDPDRRIIYVNGNKTDSSGRNYSKRYIKATAIIFELCNMESVRHFQKINREEKEAKQAGRGNKNRYATKIEHIEYSHIMLYNKIINEIKDVKSLTGIEKDKYNFKNKAEYLKVQKKSGHFYTYFRDHNLL